MQPDSVADVSPRTGLSATSRPRVCAPATSWSACFEKYVLPHWRDRAFADIKRTDVARLLDAVEDKHGHWVADSVLSVLRSLASLVRQPQRRLRAALCQKHAAHPAAGAQAHAHLERRRAARGLASGRGRRRRLRRLRPAVAALTAQRREKLATMQLGRLSDDGVWTIPTRAAREGQPRRAAAAAAGHDDHRGAAAHCR